MATLFKKNESGDKYRANKISVRLLLLSGINLPKTVLSNQINFRIAMSEVSNNIIISRAE